MADEIRQDGEQGTPRGGDSPTKTPSVVTTEEGKKSAAKGGGGALRRMWMAASHRHWIAVCFAVGCPLLVNARFSGSRGVLEPGAALLPAMYMLHWLFQQKFYENLYMLPLIVVAMVAVNRNFGSDGDGAGNVLPSLMDGAWGDAPSPVGFSDGQRTGVTRRWSDSPGLDILMSVIPSLSLLFHYGMVWLATKVYKSKRGEIEISCDNFSNYLLRKCYGELSLPTWLYIKKSRVLPSIATILKILISASMIIATAASLAAPSDVVGLWYRPFPTDEDVRNFAWIHFAMLCLEETIFHCFIVLSGNFHKLKLGIRASFAEHAVMMTYWEWYFIGLFSPTKAIWLPIMMMWIRFIPVSLSRLHDKSEMFSTAIALIDLAHGILLFALHFTGAAYIPHALIYRQLSNGIIRMEGYVSPILKRREIYKSATDPVSCKIYLPVGHSEIDCAHRRWMASVPLINKGPIDLPACACGRCTAVYYPEGELKLERKEYRMSFDSTTSGEWVSFVREIQMPGAWIVITAGKCAGIKMSPAPFGTALEGQFREVHSLVDSVGCLRGIGEFGGNLFVAKAYKRDPDTGYELDVSSNVFSTQAERNAAHNRLQRLSKVYFKDTLMSEKAAEFARAFNEIKMLVRSIQVMRSVVIELEYESDKPLLYVVERYLEGGQPFQKFNNNDYVPGHHSKVNTPNMFSLFTYFASMGKLLLCDVQGKGTSYTDMQFHTSTDAGGSDSESDGEDGPQYEWLHGDGGLEMQKRVLVGLFQQKALHTLARKVWPAQVNGLSRDINSWLSDPQFSQVIKELEKKAQIYSVYFTTLSPVMMTEGMGGNYHDMEKSLHQRLNQSMHGMEQSPRNLPNPTRSQSSASEQQMSIYAQSHEWDTVPATMCCGLLPGFTTRIVPTFPKRTSSAHTIPKRTPSAHTAPRKSNDVQDQEDTESMMSWREERREERRGGIAVKRQQQLQKVMQDGGDFLSGPFQSACLQTVSRSVSRPGLAPNVQKSRSAHRVPRLPALALPNERVQSVGHEEDGRATPLGPTASTVTRRLPSVKTTMIDDNDDKDVSDPDVSLRDWVPRSFSRKGRTSVMQGVNNNSFSLPRCESGLSSTANSSSHGSVLRSSPEASMMDKSPVLHESRAIQGFEDESLGVVEETLAVASPLESAVSQFVSDVQEELMPNTQAGNTASLQRHMSQGSENGNFFNSVKSDGTECPNPPSQPDESLRCNPGEDDLGHQEDGMLRSSNAEGNFLPGAAAPSRLA